MGDGAPSAPWSESLLVYARGLLVALVFLAPLVVAPGAVDSVMLVKLTVLWLFGIAALVLTLLAAPAGISRPRPTLTTALALAYGAALLVATGLSERPATSLLGLHRRYGGLVPQLLYVALMLTVVAAHRRQPDRLGNLARSAAVASGLVSAYVLVQAAGLDWYRWTIGGQPSEFPISTLGNSNFVGGYLAITLPLTFYVAGRAQRPWRPSALAVGCGIQALALWYTHTRGGLLAALIASITYALLIRPWPHWIRSGAALGAIAVAFGGIALLWTGEWGPSTLVRTDTLVYRLAYWRSGVAMFVDRPLIGTGPDTFYANYGRYERSEQAGNQPTTRVDKPHNVLLERATDAGILGVGTYLALVLACMSAARRHLRTSSGQERALVVAFLAALVGYLVQSFFSIDVPPLAFMGWIALGGLVASTRPRQKATPAPWPPGSPQVFQPRRGRLARPLALGAVGLALLVVGVRPLRAEVAAQDGRLDRAMALQPREAAYPASAGDIVSGRALRSSQPDEQRRYLGQAHSYYLQAVRLRPHDVLYAAKLAALNMFWGEKLDPARFEVAAGWWRRAIAISPRNPGLRNQYRAVQETIRRNAPLPPPATAENHDALKTGGA